MDSNSSLPTEIWIDIIQLFGLPSQTSPYRLERASIFALTRLCLVSHTFHVLAEPVLYSTAFITPNSSESFSTAVTSPQSRADGFPSGKFTKKGALVKSLALADFGFPEAPHVQQIETILSAVGSSVLRLFIDTSRVDPTIISASVCLDLDATIQDALSIFSKIEELCLLHWDSYSLPLASWPTLKRIVIANSSLSTNLLAQLSRMKNLELCILAWPISVQSNSPPNFKFDLREVAQGDWGVSGEGRGAHNLAITVTKDFDLVVHLLARPSETQNQSGNEETRVKRPALMLMDVPEVPGGLVDRNKKWDWTTRVVLDGTIWERQREAWDAYVGRLYPS
ncbi:hypothetical protein FRB95_006994 [Tulasnella sp. JGI-2019a]|nr:hypothetical protein FRB95_006994 [Tulasnella sp. JGI-2019a]